MIDATEQDLLLADGSPPMPVAVFLQRLEQLGIAHVTTEHAAVFTVDEAKAVRGRLDGAHVKNLFLRNKKGQMWLLTCLEDRQLDLKALAERVGGNRFSFASAERLMKYLGVIPGAVTAFAAVNDPGNKVTVLLDAALMNHDKLNLHPLVNTMTTCISPADLLRFLESIAHVPQIVELDDILR
jgi:Ala-tRNA(Pro) deacylase